MHFSYLMFISDSESVNMDWSVPDKNLGSFFCSIRETSETPDQQIDQQTELESLVARPALTTPKKGISCK